MCVPTSGNTIWTCDLTANGDTTAANITLVYGAACTTGNDYCAWGDDAAGNAFCCETTAGSLVGATAIGGIYNDSIQFWYSSYNLQNHTTSLFDGRAFGGLGDDTIDGSFATSVNYRDKLNGDGNNDLITGNDGADELNGDAGEDDIAGGYGNDLIHGGSGDDTLAGDDDNDEIAGDDGADVISGGLGDDTLRGNDNQDNIAGNEGADDVQGGDDPDNISGGDGDDTLRGDQGEDFVCGDDGDDTLYGNSENDTLHDSVGTNTKYGGTHVFGGDNCNNVATNVDCEDITAFTRPLPCPDP